MSFPRWQFVMIHHSAGDDSQGVEAEQIRRWHTEGRGWQDTGYHFVCELVYDSYQVLAARPLFLPGAHCPGFNRTAIGLCLVGNFDQAEPPSDQLAAAARFVAGLCAALNIQPEQIKQHRDHRATACPGEHFNLADFRRRVSAELGVTA